MDKNEKIIEAINEIKNDLNDLLEYIVQEEKQISYCEENKQLIFKILNYLKWKRC